jgi:RHS repeat-associated protein
MWRNDYYPGGSLMPGRSFNSNTYRYGGAGGQEMDNEVSGVGNSYTAHFWQYDPRLGRRWNVDPITYPWQSSYAAFNNNPIIYVDPLGLEGIDPKKDGKGGSGTTAPNGGTRNGEGGVNGGDAICIGCGANGENTYGLPGQESSGNSVWSGITQFFKNLIPNVSVYGGSKNGGTGSNNDNFEYNPFSFWPDGMFMVDLNALGELLEVFGMMNRKNAEGLNNSQGYGPKKDNNSSQRGNTSLDKQPVTGSSVSPDGSVLSNTTGEDIKRNIEEKTKIIHMTMHYPDGRVDTIGELRVSKKDLYNTQKKADTLRWGAHMFNNRK